MAAAQFATVNDAEARVCRDRQFLIELLCSDMASRFDQEGNASMLKRRAQFAKKLAGVGHLMDHGEREGEIHLTGEVQEFHAIRPNQACLHAAPQAGFGGPLFEDREHLRLDVHRDNPSGVSDASRQFQSEKAHAGSGLQHGHAFPDIRREYLRRILEKSPERASQ